jgi:hypothetical protein
MEHVQDAVKEGARAAPPFRLALERIQADPEVKGRVGEPIQEGIPSLFNYRDATDGGDAEFKYAVSGPKGSAAVHVVGEKIEDRWWFRRLDVTFEDGETISLEDADIPIQLE